MKYLIVSALLLGCGPQASEPPTVVKTSDTSFTVKNNFLSTDCSFVRINNMRCIVCNNRYGGGGITCNWNEYMDPSLISSGAK